MKTLRLSLVAMLVLNAIPSSSQAAEASAPALENSTERAAINQMQGKPTPELQVTQWINSKPLSIADLKGKIVVIDFWATWCGPCLQSIPHNNELQKKFADKGVVFVAVCAPKGGEKMAETVKQHGIQYAVALDQGQGDTFAAYKANSYPDYFIIDRKGRLRWGDIVNGDVEKAIELLVAEKE